MEKNNDVLILNNISKIYNEGQNETVALDNINLKVKKNEFLSIVGPSGSGKSTLLHILGLLDYQTKGEIYLDQFNVKNLNENEKARFRGEKIGFIFQMFNLLNNYTALENVALPLLIHGFDESKANEKAEEYLEKMNLQHRLNHKPNQLSGGQKQRVAIARALIMEPTYLLADEPTGNLDSKTSNEIIEIFKELHDNGKTLIMVTHNPKTTRGSDRIIHLKDGKIDKEEVKK